MEAGGHTIWQEWRTGTDPTNTLSVLRLLSATPNGTNVTVRWQSIAGVNYFLERSTGLEAAPYFTPLVIGLPGQPGTMNYMDSSPGVAPRLFHRVGVGN